jgi:hypothetical protein
MGGEERAKELVTSLPPADASAPSHGIFKLVLEDPASVKAASEFVKEKAGGKVHVLVNSGKTWAAVILRLKCSLSTLSRNSAVFCRRLGDSSGIHEAGSS